MDILYDHQIFSAQEYGGISRYFFETASRVSKYNDAKVKCSVVFSNNEYIRDSNIISASPFFRNSKLVVKRKLIKATNQLASIWALRKDNFDVFHPTYYDPYYFNLSIKKPIVVTCFDLIHEKFLPRDKEIQRRKNEAMAKATRIIAISESTKRDIIDYYHIEENKIDVVYLAGSLNLNLDTHTMNHEEQDFLLFVGGRDGYKNFIFFVKSIARLLKEKKIVLIAFGGGRFSKEELKMINELQLEEMVRHVAGSDSDLVTLYSNAIALVYPSLYEGFGIPLLEAMECGCPVIAGNNSSLPEVGGDAVLYFDAESEKSIYLATYEIIENKKLRKELVEKSSKQLEKFSWDKTATKHYKIYESLL